MVPEDGPTYNRATRDFLPKHLRGYITCSNQPDQSNCQDDVVQAHWRRFTSFVTGYQSSSASVKYISPYSTQRPPQETGPLSHSLNTSLFSNERELRSYTFFRECTIPSISGFFEFDFWGRLMLQAIHHESAIRHAAIALGAIHEGFISKDEKWATDDNFAVQQYLKSISLLLEPIKEHGKQAVDVALVTCVLYICFETLRGHQGAALSHIIGGVKIISELSSQPSNTSLSLSTLPYIPLSVLNLIFIRLNTQAGTISFSRGPQIPTQALSNGPTGFHASIPLAFTSVAEAYNSLNYIATIESRTLPQEIPISTPFTALESAQMAIQMELSRSIANLRFQKWNSAFEAQVLSTPKQDSETIQALQILRVHKTLMGVIFHMDFSRAMMDEMIWDEYTPEFESIMLLVEEIVLQERQNGDFRRCFNLDTGIIFPLYFTAVKCRDFRLRWRAVELLKERERQEGVWNSVLTAKVAERLLWVEEAGLEGRNTGPEGVLREKRVVDVDLRFDMGDRKAVLRYGRGSRGLRNNGANMMEEGKEEYIVW